MKAIILAGGKGKRLKEITRDIPKVLVKAGDKTLIEHNIEKLKNLGIKDIAVVVGYKADAVKNILGGSVTYFTQNKQLGTANALSCAKDFIDETFFITMNGDVFFEDTLSNFIGLKPPAIAAYFAEDTSEFGRLLIKSGKLVNILEKSTEPAGGLLNAGVYLLPKGIFDLISQTPLSLRGEYELTDTIKMLIERGLEFKVYKLRGYWKDVGFRKDLEEVEELLRE